MLIVKKETDNFISLSCDCNIQAERVELLNFAKKLSGDNWFIASGGKIVCELPLSSTYRWMYNGEVREIK